MIVSQQPPRYVREALLKGNKLPSYHPNSTSFATDCYDFVVVFSLAISCCLRGLWRCTKVIGSQGENELGSQGKSDLYI